jgi:hypothetical protein
MRTNLCPLCSSRRAKRSCPALEREICPVCCGTKRLTEIRCPESCVYLSSSKAHPAAVVQRRQERDLGFLLPFWSDLTEPQYRLLLLFQAVTLKHAAEALLPLRDEDVAEATSVTAATFETARKGIIYEHQASAVPAQRLADALRDAFDELVRQSGGSVPPRLERDTALVLRRIEQTALKAAKALPDDEPPVFLRLIGRVLKQSDRATADADPGTPAGPSEGRLIIP